LFSDDEKGSCFCSLLLSVCDDFFSSDLAIFLLDCANAKLPGSKTNINAKHFLPGDPKESNLMFSLMSFVSWVMFFVLQGRRKAFLYRFYSKSNTKKLGEPK